MIWTTCYYCNVAAIISGWAKLLLVSITDMTLQLCRHTIWQGKREKAVTSTSLHDVVAVEAWSSCTHLLAHAAEIPKAQRELHVRAPTTPRETRGGPVPELYNYPLVDTEFLPLSAHRYLTQLLDSSSPLVSF